MRRRLAVNAIGMEVGGEVAVELGAGEGEQPVAVEIAVGHQPFHLGADPRLGGEQLLFVADRNNDRVQILSLDGAVVGGHRRVGEGEVRLLHHVVAVHQQPEVLDPDGALAAQHPRAALRRAAGLPARKWRVRFGRNLRSCRS